MRKPGKGWGWGTGWMMLVLLACAVSAGCHPESISDAPSAECAAIGAQCQLPDGPLGVCQEAPCEPGKTRPCFKCTSQH